MTPKQAFLYQAGACDDLGSPFMGRLMRAIAPRVAHGGPIYDRINAWTGDLSPRGASVPLRLAGALHRLVLSGTSPDLAAAYPPNTVDDATLLNAVEHALTDHSGIIDHWLDSPPQTNEVRRSVALIAAAHWLTAKTGLPLTVSELGASAGLNLCFDRYAMQAGSVRFGPEDAATEFCPDCTGPVPPATELRIADRRGVDLRPVSTGDPDDRTRLLSYLWADQPARMSATRAAIDTVNATGVVVDAADAGDWLQSRLAAPRPGQVHLIYHTIAWQYFPEDTVTACSSAISSAAAKATAQAPIAWLGLEADGHKPGAGLRLRFWPGDLDVALARVDFHGRWIDWTAPPA